MSFNTRPLETVFFRVCCLLIILGLRPVKTSSSVAQSVMPGDAVLASQNSGALKLDERITPAAGGVPLLDSTPKPGRIQKIVNKLRKTYAVPGAEVPTANPSMRLCLLHRMQSLQELPSSELKHPHSSAHMMHRNS